MLASYHHEIHHLPLSRLAEPCIRALPTIWLSSLNTLPLGQRHQPLSDHYGLRRGVAGFGLNLPIWLVFSITYPSSMGANARKLPRAEAGGVISASRIGSKRNR